MNSVIYYLTSEAEGNVRILLCGGVIFSAALLSGTLGLACGDKLLNVSRGLRFQRAYAGRQANLVIYSNATSSAGALKSAKLLTTVHTLYMKMGA